MSASSLYIDLYVIMGTAEASFLNLSTGIPIRKGAAGIIINVNLLPVFFIIQGLGPVFFK